MFSNRFILTYIAEKNKKRANESLSFGASAYTPELTNTIVHSITHSLTHTQMHTHAILAPATGVLGFFGAAFEWVPVGCQKEEEEEEEEKEEEEK